MEGFKQDEIKVNLTENAKMIFKNNQFLKINISLKGNSATDFQGKNSTNQFNAIVKDNSMLIINKLQVQKTNIQAD